MRSSQLNGPRGFTTEYARRRRQFLVSDWGPTGWDCGGGPGAGRYVVPAAELKAALRRLGLPRRALGERQNNGPRLARLLAAPAVAYEVYIIGPGRADERITIDGVYLPVDQEPPADWRAADEDDVIEYNGRPVRRLWWD